jgi:hypothetical protein
VEFVEEFVVVSIEIRDMECGKESFDVAGFFKALNSEGNGFLCNTEFFSQCLVGLPAIQV